MKTKLLYTVLALLAAHFAAAQVLWSENFDNFTIGNIGTDHTGNTPGQGGWYTHSNTTDPANASNNYFKIVAEPGRGNVMEITSPDTLGTSDIEKRGLETFWNNRTTGNEVLKIEYDFFTGDSLLNATSFWNNISGTNLTQMLRAIYHSNSSEIFSTSNGYNGRVAVLYETPIPRNTWLKLIFYIDYVNKKTYSRIPSLAIGGENNFFDAGTPPDIPSVMAFYVRMVNSHSQQCVFKIDNIVFSAVNTVPPLDIKEWVSSKFNVFPNPVTDVVTITNNENIGIEEILIYDINGKTVKLQHCENKNEVQLNMESFASGTYLLHIKTNQGTAIKKLIKN